MERPVCIETTSWDAYLAGLASILGQHRAIKNWQVDRILRPIAKDERFESSEIQKAVGPCDWVDEIRGEMNLRFPTIWTYA
ncbi:MAG: hypothetical protein ACLTK0_10500 [Anaerovoracaceae bacterium]